MSSAALALLALGVSADAFVVALGRGTALRRFDLRATLVLALVLGGFQAAMPLAGWALGDAFLRQLAALDPWLPAGVLLAVGALMLAACAREDDAGAPATTWGPAVLLAVGVATSLDAFAVGVGLAVRPVDIVLAATVIGLTASTLSGLGTVVGHRLGRVHGRTASAAGGCLLLGLGTQVLLTA